MSDDAVVLEDVVKRLDTCEADVGRLEGRQQQATEEVERVEAECRELGVEPDGLEAAVTDTQAQQAEHLASFNDAVTALEADVATAAKVWSDELEEEAGAE